MKAQSPKVVYIATFDDGEQYTGFCDKYCRRLRPFFEGRVGFKGRLQTKFREQNRCWGYTAPVYVHSRKHEIVKVEIVATTNNRAAAMISKKHHARSLNKNYSQ